MIDRNNADENAAFMRLAERLVQQQDAAVSSPAAIHANIPEQGRMLSFSRAVLVDPWADLQIHIAVGQSRSASWSTKAATLAGTFLLFAIFGVMARGSARLQRP